MDGPELSLSSESPLPELIDSSLVSEWELALEPELSPLTLEADNKLFSESAEALLESSSGINFPFP